MADANNFVKKPTSACAAVAIFILTILSAPIFPTGGDSASSVLSLALSGGGTAWLFSVRDICPELPRLSPVIFSPGISPVHPYMQSPLYPSFPADLLTRLYQKDGFPSPVLWEFLR